MKFGIFFIFCLVNICSELFSKIIFKGSWGPPHFVAFGFFSPKLNSLNQITSIFSISIVHLFHIYLSEFARRWPLRFWLEHGHPRAQAIVAAQNAGGLRSRPAFPRSPRAVLTVAGRLIVVC